MPLRTEREVRRRRGCWLGSTEGNRCKLGMENGNWDSAGCDAGALWSQALRLWSTLKYQNQNWHQYWTPLQNLFFFVDLDRSPFFHVYYKSSTEMNFESAQHRLRPITSTLSTWDHPDKQTKPAKKYTENPEALKRTPATTATDDGVVSREEGFRYSHSKSLFPCIHLAGDDPGQR